MRVNAGQSNERAQLLAVENSGERMVPEISASFVFWEHVYRYGFASRFVRGKRVLDVACGEGYGSAGLREAGAKHVIGVDISEGACRHARSRYGLDARLGSAKNIPLDNGSVDVVVSFETIEHVPQPIRFLEECARVLTPGGRLIISTPNREVYSAPGRPINPHHCSEMSEKEFVTALGANFYGITLYSQHLEWAPWWTVRTLSADRTPWGRFKWFRRLLRSAQFRTCPICVCDPSAEERASAANEVAAAGRRTLSPLNPYVLRPRAAWTGERPFYLVATAVSKGRGSAKADA